MTAPPFVLPLNARIFGEWLAALGLVRVANSICPHSTLCFDEEGHAVLSTGASECDLVRRIVESANPASVTVRCYSSVKAPGVSTVRIGDGLFSLTERSLAADGKLRVFLENEDAKPGLLIRLDALGGLDVAHFLGKAMTDCAGLKSPLKLWAGTISLPTILRQLTTFVAVQPTETPLKELLSQRLRSTQRLRFDSTGEQFMEDGGHNAESGAETRPAIEWLGFIALSFFPPEAGFTALLESRRRLRAGIWHHPLEAPAILLALHNGQFDEFQTFAIASDGKLKKIRPAGAGQTTRKT